MTDTAIRVSLYTLVLGLSILLGSLVANAASVSQAPTVASNLTGVGTVAWTSASSALSCNGDYDNDARANSIGSGETTNYLYFSDFDFAIPTTATVTGVEVSPVVVLATDTNQYGYVNARLYVDGAISTTETRTSGLTLIPNTPSPFEFGGPSDLWGLSLTPDDINDPTFGYGFYMVGDSSDSYFGVSCTSVTVYYEESETPTTTPSVVVDNSHQIIFFGILLFYLTFFLVMYIFKRR